MSNIAKLMKNCYNVMMTARRILTVCGAAAVIASQLPAAAYAYLNPYDVLLSQELLLPSAARDAQSRVERQQDESAARRDREQEEIFAEQHPATTEETTLLEAAEDDTALHDAAGSTEINYELNALLRSLERISDQQTRARAESEIRQQAFLLLQAEGNVLQLHEGAPVLPGYGTGLAPTGAGTALAVLVLFSAIAWTVYRAQKGSRLTHAGS